MMVTMEITMRVTVVRGQPNEKQESAQTFVSWLVEVWICRREGRKEATEKCRMMSAD